MTAIFASTIAAPSGSKSYSLVAGLSGGFTGYLSTVPVGTLNPLDYYGLVVEGVYTVLPQVRFLLRISAGGVVRPQNSVRKIRVVRLSDNGAAEYLSTAATFTGSTAFSLWDWPTANLLVNGQSYRVEITR